MTQETAIDKITEYIKECEEDYLRWEAERELCEKKLKLCQEAMDTCTQTLAKYREIIGEILIGQIDETD